MQELTVGAGLQNLGNTCFFNAVLQSVLHNKKLASYLANKNHSKNCQNKQWCVFCEMENAYQSTRSMKVYSPKNLVHNLKKIFRKFKLGRQQDSHQFLRYLIQGMQECQAGKSGKQREVNENKIKKTKIFNIFGGIIKNVVSCLNCKHKSITQQRYYDLNIECQRSNTLDQGLQRFFTTDELKGHNKYLCENCKNRVEATKRCYLQTSPKTFTFQLKRFTNMMRKIGKFIKFPKYIHLGKYFDHEHNTVARISAVIVHSGMTAYSGHYFSYVRVGQAWYRMDDSFVTKSTEEQAMGQSAYILMYQKIKDQTVDKSDMIDEKEDKKQIFQLKQQKTQSDDVMDQQPEKQAKLSLFPLQSGYQPDLTPASLNISGLQPLGPRKRSKQQAESNMTIQQYLMRYTFSLQNLHGKLPEHGHGYKALRPVHNLRKYEIAMKRRKLQAGMT